MALALAASNTRDFEPFRPCFYPMTFEAETAASNDCLEVVAAPPLEVIMFDADGGKYALKIDPETGEVISNRKIPLPSGMRKARPRTSLTVPWEPTLVTVGTSGTNVNRRDPADSEIELVDKSRVKHLNNCQAYLMHLRSLGETNELTGLPASLWGTTKRHLPLLIEIIESANFIDMGGNTRGLNQGALLAILEQCSIISPYTIQSCMGYSERHSQRVAECLRVITNQFDLAVGNKLSTTKKLTPPKEEEDE